MYFWGGCNFVEVHTEFLKKCSQYSNSCKPTLNITANFTASNSKKDEEKNKLKPV